MTDFDLTSGKFRKTLVLMLAGGALALTACGDKVGSPTAGQKMDSAIAKTEQAGADAKAKADKMASEVKAKTESTAANASGTVDDAAITAGVSMGLAKDPDLSAIKIDVDTKSGVVSLSGPAPNAAAKARAEEIAKSVKGVIAVSNNLVVKAM
jgi:osmotically-inducible protein OsmY